jgi:hypothetical protein
MPTTLVKAQVRQQVPKTPLKGANAPTLPMQAENFRGHNFFP